MVKITQVEKRSHADKAGLIAGDILVSINGSEINDVLDYRFYLAERKVEIAYIRDGESRTASIVKGEYSESLAFFGLWLHSTATTISGVSLSSRYSFMPQHLP